MPNGRNAGRLFPDCNDEHGYGASHAFDEEPKRGQTIEKVCVACGRYFRLTKSWGGEVTVHEIEGHEVNPG